MLPSPANPDDKVCSYCGQPLDARFYFCTRCSKPFRAVETVLSPRPDPYADTETRLRVNARSAWNIYFIYLSVIVAGSVAAIACWGLDSREPAIITLDLMLLVTTCILLAGRWQEVAPLLKRAGVFHPATWAGLALLVPALGLNYAYHSILTELVPMESADPSGFFTSRFGGIVFICVLPAVVEEIGFRGIIQHEFEKAVSPALAIGIAAAAFSAAHFSVLSAPYLALLGALLGWMKWKTGSLYPSMVAHFLHNFVVIGWF